MTRDIIDYIFLIPIFLLGLVILLIRIFLVCALLTILGIAYGLLYFVTMWTWDIKGDKHE